MYQNIKLKINNILNNIKDYLFFKFSPENVIKELNKLTEFKIFKPIVSHFKENFDPENLDNEKEFIASDNYIKDLIFFYGSLKCGGKYIHTLTQNYDSELSVHFLIHRNADLNFRIVDKKIKDYLVKCFRQAERIYQALFLQVNKLNQKATA